MAEASNSGETGVIRTTTCETVKDQKGRKVINGKYVLENTIASNILCKLKVASVVNDPTRKVVLKTWKKQVLRSKKEYHRKKGGHGMVATDQLMKVMDHEVKAMLRLSEGGAQCPNVVRLHEIIDDEAGFEDKLILVMELCTGGQLLNWSPENHNFTANTESERVDANGMVEESTIKTVLKEISNGLKFCHDKGVLHRDIKPQNIIFGEDHRAKLIDFGVSTILEDPAGSDNVKQTEGTYHFMAPEACDPDIDEYSGKAADVWALGVTLYTLLFNKCPFWGETEYRLMESIRNNQVEIPEDSNRQVSAELIAILMQMLDKSPATRITIAQLLENPWLSQP